MVQIEDGASQVVVSKINGEAVVTFTDLLSGKSWGPVPAFKLKVFSILLRRTEIIAHPEVVIVSGDTWIEITQSVDNQMFSASATVRLTLEAGELVVRVPTDQIEEGNPEIALLDALHILPNLMRITPETPGHLVLPYRTGALCFPEKHPRGHDEFLIYGEQNRWELMPMLPFCGSVRTETNDALMTIVEQGDCDAECRVETDGLGSGDASFSLRYRYTRIDPVDPIDRVMRFVPLRNENANYAGMGRRLNAFVLKKAGRGTLTERANQNPELAYAADSFVLKIMHGCKEIGPLDGSGPYHLYTTCDQAIEQLSQLKSSGFDRLMVQLTGWNLEGHDGCWPTRFPVEPSIGGEAGLRRLIAHGQALGYQMQVHDNYLDLYRRSESFDPEMCTGDIYGGPLKRGCWAGGINYIGWPLAYPKSDLNGQMEEVRDLGPRGVGYLDAMGLPLEISYNTRHGSHRYRRACADGVNRILQVNRETFGATGTENGYLYCVVECDYIGSPFVGAQPEPVSEFIDCEVPLWFMAVKGHIFSNLNDTYNSAVDFKGRSSETVSGRMLQMAELGLLPRNEGVAVYGEWGYPLEEAIEAMKLEYDLMLGPLSGIGMASLVDHSILEGDPMLGDHITRSRYSNGIETLCDYRNSRLEINGVNYPLPNDFVKRPVLVQGTRSPLAAEQSHTLAQEVGDYALV